MTTLDDIREIILVETCVRKEDLTRDQDFALIQYISKIIARPKFEIPAQIEREIDSILVSPKSLRKRIENLGSSLIEFHSQERTVAASMIAEEKVSGQRS